MNKPGIHIKESLSKRLQAYERYKTLEKEYHTSREEIIREIEEARALWMKTREMLPKTDFEL
jgi:hypothetical protein